ncbi:tetratricopeptide repeat protein [Aliikangiella sp. IMCC44632]
MALNPLTRFKLTHSLKVARCLVAVIALVLCSTNAMASLEQADKAYQAKQYEEALELYLPLAEQGNSDAQARLASMYFWGHGVRKQPSKTYAWSLKAAKQSNPKGQHMQAYLYENGVFVTQNKRKAIQWYKLAAEQEYAPAMAIMASHYIFAEVLPKNIAKGLQLAKKAAKKDEPMAQYLMGYLYETEYKDVRAALKWYQLAAENHYAMAANQIGLIYYQGTGLAGQDLNSAYRWFIIAEELGSPEGFKNKPIIQAKIKPALRKSIEEEAQRWLNNHPYEES